jgi:hypothetical protein
VPWAFVTGQLRHSPWQNGHAERLIGSPQRKCPDHVVVFAGLYLRCPFAATRAYGAAHRVFAGGTQLKIRSIEDFARQIFSSLRGVMSRLVARFPENSEILDLMKSEYRAGRPIPDIEKAVAALIETGKSLPHTHQGNSSTPRRLHASAQIILQTQPMAANYENALAIGLDKRNTLHSHGPNLRKAPSGPFHSNKSG